MKSFGKAEAGWLGRAQKGDPPKQEEWAQTKVSTDSEGAEPLQRAQGKL